MVDPVSVPRLHFEEYAARLSDCATLQTSEDHGATFLRIVPRRPDAVGVVLYLGNGYHGTVQLDDQAAVPAELSEDVALAVQSIDEVIRLAVEGRATAFHLGRGGCLEERNAGATTRSWRNAWPWPGWRRRAHRVDFLPYR
ncbi:hypothetical protein HN031_12925 [Nocardioides sp. zg-1308]|uniref:hypothetical protein n=1 Tax=Nocardioides sp. zg-1308 TaxID=2736253 RepID=UPI0015543726|nr:hypothetical protein [Nocardioides sp. zg-1308]NPD05589.1 hypothetical protein [Nocardioides sp. zg-1308]